MVAFMSVLTKVLRHVPSVTDSNLSTSTLRRQTKMFQYISAYSIYIISIMTNHEGTIKKNSLTMKINLFIHIIHFR